jgi:hypothetical protein
MATRLPDTRSVNSAGYATGVWMNASDSLDTSMLPPPPPDQRKYPYRWSPRTPGKNPNGDDRLNAQLAAELIQRAKKSPRGVRAALGPPWFLSILMGV